MGCAPSTACSSSAHTCSQQSPLSLAVPVPCHPLVQQVPGPSHSPLLPQGCNIINAKVKVLSSLLGSRNRKLIRPVPLLPVTSCP